MPSIGSVLGHPRTNALEPQHVKIVDMFLHRKLYIKLLEEVQWYFPIVVWGNVEKHVPYVHPMVSNGWTDAPLNRNMWPPALQNVIHPRNSKQCIYVFFGYLQLLYLIVAQTIDIFSSFCFPIGCDAIQSIIRSRNRINYCHQ